jgi:hypothetical protein
MGLSNDLSPSLHVARKADERSLTLRHRRIVRGNLIRANRGIILIKRCIESSDRRAQITADRCAEISFVPAKLLLVVHLSRRSPQQNGRRGALDAIRLN